MWQAIKSLVGYESAEVLTVPPVIEPKPPVRRSGKWAKVRADYLKANPFCRACGCKEAKLLEVHHRLPVHRYGSLELDPFNLITLCESPSHNCHLIWGHFMTWQSWNVDVEKDADTYRAKKESRPGVGH